MKKLLFSFFAIWMCILALCVIMLENNARATHRRQTTTKIHSPPIAADVTPAFTDLCAKPDVTAPMSMLGEKYLKDSLVVPIQNQEFGSRLNTVAYGGYTPWRKCRPPIRI